MTSGGQAFPSPRPLPPEGFPLKLLLPSIVHGARLGDARLRVLHGDNARIGRAMADYDSAAIGFRPLKAERSRRGTDE